MSNQPPYGVAEIYSEYISRRQSGDPVEDVVRELQQFADQLSKGERKQLAQLVQGWEARDGVHYKPMPKRSPEASGDSSAQRPIRRLDSPPKKPSVIRPLEPIGPASDPEQRQVCPHCGKFNHQNDTHCCSCGHILIITRTGTKALDDKDMDPAMRWGTAHFGQSSVILLSVRGASKPIEVTPKAEMIIGRSADHSAMCPDIDLSAYNAEDLGVSRLHAALRRMENTVAVVDLDSVNHTFINGQRLHPHEVRVLRDGDELRLGKLALKVTFKNQIRRLAN
jgi:FHA domain-containing protein